MLKKATIYFCLFDESHFPNIFTLNTLRPNPKRSEKINLNLYIHTSLSWGKNFFYLFLALKKIFEAPQRSFKINKLIFILKCEH